ncbi:MULTISPECIES: DUF445 domain-containing protein [Capnocytophaga]|uniref:Putative conserved transmembrane protein n=1 Tax=Capnocytophaga canis TaxID=1848903 RepID=A0A0B7HWR4_9FLAO|nr:MULTISPECIES: DUF445 domain-containing protein [Capnocytophaga]ATA72290.1 DUF445 domain-containing protein [Capnocytophaga sp. H4358]CEN43049.1 putative conserved transmembrane protein [Capnocytophaga canis]
MKDKERKLRYHKRMATTLFLIMVVLYVTMVFLQKRYPETSLIGYIKAFSEAAMVGALADWFAVTALFHKPLGLPIPHTNLIENRKKSIGDNLGGFVVDNFLKPEGIRPYVEEVKITPFLAEWLSKEKNINTLTNEISEKIVQLVNGIDEENATDFITQKSKELLHEIELKTLISKSLDYIMEEKEHQKLLSFILQKIETYIWENKSLVQEKVSSKSAFFIPKFVDDILADKITEGLANYVAEIIKDPEHSVRKEVDSQLNAFSKDIQTSSAWSTKIENIKSQIINSKSIDKYALQMWKYLKDYINNDLAKPTTDSTLKQYFYKYIQKLSLQLHTDVELQQKINRQIQKTAYQFILKNRHEVGILISRTVGNWQGKELSRKLELEVGKDLQFIRINGTVVGGLAGVLIYAITQFL